jgi:hybrid polyketide synthase / nonribosomal peptide synthetase ACE1
MIYLTIRMSSFGFGGANVHAILESYEPGNLSTKPGISSTFPVFTPFVFSAFSEASLIANLESFHEYLQENLDSINLRDLAYTMYNRRTGFQVTTAIAASSVEDLSRKVAQIKDAGKDADKPAITRVPRQRASQSDRPRFLGIFVSVLRSSLGWNNQIIDVH